MSTVLAVASDLDISIGLFWWAVGIISALVGLGLVITAVWWAKEADDRTTGSTATLGLFLVVVGAVVIYLLL